MSQGRSRDKLPVRSNRTSQIVLEVGETSHHRSKNWNDEDKKMLVNLVREQFLLGNFSSGAPNTLGWNLIVTTINSTSGTHRTKDQYKQAWKNIRTLFRKYETLANKSGWAWDDVQCRPIQSPEVWDEFLKDNDDYKVCRFRSFPMFEIMKEILNETYATGEFRRTNVPTCPPRSPEPTTEDLFASEYRFVDEVNPFHGDPMSTTPDTNSTVQSKRNSDDLGESQSGSARRRRTKSSLFQ